MIPHGKTMTNLRDQAEGMPGSVEEIIFNGLSVELTSQDSNSNDRARQVLRGDHGCIQDI
jgi:hypothetical protein